MGLILAMKKNKKRAQNSVPKFFPQNEKTA
jgi:hypothetical protein